MVIPNIVKGGDMRGLLRYLVGPGRANEHQSPHVITSDGFLSAWLDTEVLDTSSVSEMTSYLEEPRKTFGTEIQAQTTTQDPATGEKVVTGYRVQHVWHCSLSLKADDGVLSDEKWATITQQFVDRMGLSEASGKAPCRWVAIHHGASSNGNDHVHIAASMIREDGTRWEGRYRDFPRAQEVCRELEIEHGLTRVEGRTISQLAERGERPAERRQAAKAGLASTAPKELADRVRAAALASTSEAEWIRRVRADGTVVKPYYAKGSTEVVTGYRAALRPESYNDKLAFYGGGSLGRDLSLPRLRENWPPPSIQAAGAASQEWQAAFRGRAPTTNTGRDRVTLTGLAPDVQKIAIERWVQFNDRLTRVPISDRVAWADAARDGAGVLAAWARMDPDHDRELRAASAAMSRCAQLHRAPLDPGRRVKESPMGTALILLSAVPGKEQNKIAGAVFLRQVIKTAEALRDHHRVSGQLREAQAVHREVVQRLERISLIGYRASVPAGRELSRAARDRRPEPRRPSDMLTPDLPRPSGARADGQALPLPRPLGTPQKSTAETRSSRRNARRDYGR